MSTRKILTPEQKIAIVREHLIEKVPVSEVCDKHGISVVNFYNWQKLLFENAAGAFERKKNAANVRMQQDANAAKIEKLEAKLQQKNEVIAELLQEHVELKKELGES
ncbi:transposase [Aureliella helgolandensis]|uniref:Transposase n=1 Tax=Aureliella helgolandensis TaxID=2527968 RepID=A0A518GB37_9BACT|nr:transposase [Aureliella helgolandensis]QDV25818.1 Transposase [Aureliella helgolandensis]